MFLFWSGKFLAENPVHFKKPINQQRLLHLFCGAAIFTKINFFFLLKNNGICFETNAHNLKTMTLSISTMFDIYNTSLQFFKRKSKVA